VYTPTPEFLSQAFDLGRSVGGLILIRRGDTDTWRLDTVTGSFFIKGYWPTTGGQFTAGGLLDQLEVAMAFEQRALEAGVDMPRPIEPTERVAGWLTSRNGRLFRTYQWIENRALRQADDIADWLGSTMARVHRLEPLDEPGLPGWWSGAIRPQETWEEWFVEAERRGKSWSGLTRECLPSILDTMARIEELCRTAPDCVRTHGDFKTHNLLMTSNGPMLVDWDSVRSDSAALEAGRVAYIFGAGELEPIKRILRAYTAAGGDIGWAGRDIFLSVARHDLQALMEQIQVSLDRQPAAWWMGGIEAIEQNVGNLLRELPDRSTQLSDLAEKTSRH
jgi:hypothetical protein